MGSKSKEPEAVTSAGEIAPPSDAAGFDAYREHLRKLAKVAGDKSKWGASLSRTARGQLSGHWSTPPRVLDEARTILVACGMPGVFGLDVAADPGSAVADRWFGPFHMERDRRDALQEGLSWEAPTGTAAWLNPVYSMIKTFAARAAEPRETPLAFLSFARTDTRWFHRSILPAARAGFADVWFRQGRIAFIDPLTGKTGQVAPAPSMLVVFTGSLSGGKRGPRSVGPWVRADFSDASAEARS